LNAKEFLIDYCQRHAHPANALLHIIGVPSAFIGLCYLLFSPRLLGILLLILGYFLQYLGHKIQGNEVGEITLIKHLWHRFKGQLGN